MDATSLRLDVLTQILNGAALRHKVIAHNVANVNTPNFKRLEVSFEDELAKAIGAGDPSAVSSVKPKVVESADGVERVDGNNVDIDREMGQLTKNGLLFTAAAQILASRLASLRSAISGR